MAEACSAVDMIGLLGDVSTFVTAVVALAGLSLWSRQLTHPPRTQWMSKAIEASAQWYTASLVVLQLNARRSKPSPLEMIDKLTEAWVPLAAVYFYASAEYEQCENVLDKARWGSLVSAIAESKDIFKKLQRFVNGAAPASSRKSLENEAGEAAVKIAAAANALSYVRAPWQFD